MVDTTQTTTTRSTSRNSRDSQEENRYRRRPSSALKQRETATSPEEQRAKKYIHDAESRIDGLLQELEDLRFLEEIDQQEHPTTATNSPPRSALSRSQSAPKIRSSNDATLKTPRGDTIPAVIRASSPMDRSARLPPPQRTTAAAPVQQQQQRPPMHPRPTNTSTEQQQQHPPLPTPRVIAKLDRMSLELETQTLARRVDVLQQEKGALVQEVDMLKLSALDQETERQATLELETDLQLVRQQLQQAKQELLGSKDKVIAEYEDALHEQEQDLERKHAVEREALERDHAKQRQELEEQVAQVADLADDVQEQLRKEQATVKELATKLVKETKRRDHALEKKEKEAEQTKREQESQLAAQTTLVSQLQQDLTRAEQSLEATKTGRDDAYEVQIASLREELSLLRDSSSKTEQDLHTQLQHCQTQLQTCEQQCTEQSSLVEDMSQRLDTVHSDYRTKFSELKDAYDTKEKRRMQELVDQHATATDTYETRIQALQQQLSHQTNRHHAELDRSVTTALEDQTLEYTAKVSAIQDELTRVREQCTAAQQETYTAKDQLRTVENELLQVKQELECQTIVQTNELARVSETSERVVKEKDERITKLSTELESQRQSHAARITTLQAQHVLDLKERDATATNRLRSALSTQTTDWERQETELRAAAQAELEQAAETARRQRTILETKVEAKQKCIEETEQLVKELRVEITQQTETIVTLREQLSSTQSDQDRLLQSMNDKLQSEMRLREEGATATKQLERELQQQRTDADDKLQASTERVAQLEDDLQEITRREQVCRDQITDLESQVLKGTRLVETKSERIEDLERQVTRHEELHKERVAQLETDMRQARSELISERTRHESSEEETRVDLAVLQGKLKANEASLMEKRETIEELEDKLRAIADESSSATKELQRELDRIRDELKDVTKSLDAERTESFTKDGIVKQQQKKLRENHAIILNLEERVMQLSETEQHGSRTIEELRSAVDQSKIEISAIRLRTRGAENRLQEQLSAATEKARTLEVEASERSRSIDSLNEKIAAMEEASSSTSKDKMSQITSLEEQLLSVNKELGAAREAVEQKSAEILALKASLEESKELRSSADRAAKDVQRKLDESEQQLQREVSLTKEDLDKKESMLRDEITQLERTVSEKQSKVDQLEADLQRAMTDKGADSAKAQEEIASLSQKVKSTEEQLRNEEVLAAAKLEVMDKLEAEIVTMRKKALDAAKAEQELVDLRTRLSEATETIAKRDSEIKRLQEIQTDLPGDEMNDQLRTERESKDELTKIVADLEADIQSKTQQLTRLPSLEQQIDNLSEDREQLEQQVSRLSKELAQKETEVVLSTSRSIETSSISDELAQTKCELEKLKEKNEALEREIQTKADRFDRQEEELVSKLGKAETLLASHKRQLATVQNQISTETDANLEQLKKSNRSLETKVRELEEDSHDRESQMRAAAERASNQILELQMKVEELSQTKSSLKLRLSKAQSDLDQKDELISVTSTQLSGDIADLQSRLGDQLAENETMKRTVEELESKSVDMDEMKETQSKLELEAKEKRSLKSKIGDIEYELQCKEKQIKEVVDRYSRELAELNHKLEEESTSKAALEKEIVSLRSLDDNSTKASEMKTIKEQLEKALVDQKRANEKLQAEIETLKASTSDGAETDLKPRLTAMIEENRKLHKQLMVMETSSTGSADVDTMKSKVIKLEISKKDLEQRLKKANNERAEVITALEDVISEVQSREEEIESLAQVLKKRDDELDHAKLIASKALASAQDMKARYRNKGGDPAKKQAELQAEIDFLVGQNEELETKTADMEQDLLDKEKECNELKGKLRQFQGKPNKLDGHLTKAKDDFSAFDDVGFPAFDADSPTQPDSLGFNDTMSTQSGDIQRSAGGWIHDFDSGSTSSGGSPRDDARTEPSDLHSRRSVERDALRKYVRKRYLKTKVSS